MVLEALAEEVIVGKPAVERGPRIPNLSLVSATRLLDFVTLLLWMFPDVGKKLSTLLEHDTVDIQYSVQGSPVLPTALCMRNEIRVRNPNGQHVLPVGTVRHILRTYFRSVENQRVFDLSNEHHRRWILVQLSPQPLPQQSS